MDPIPSPEELDELYGRSYFVDPSGSWSYEAQAQGQLVNFRRQIDHYKKLSTNPYVLDVGCATGEFLRAAKEAGLKASGVERSEYACGIAQSSGLSVIHGDIYDSRLKAGSYGGIHLSHVLEHVPAPQRFPNRLRDLLVPQGLVYVEVPYQFDSVLDRINALRGTHQQFALWSIHHCSFFTPVSLRRILQEQAFHVLSLKAFLAAKRAARPGSLSKYAVQSLLWLVAKIAHKGDVIAVWARL